MSDEKSCGSKFGFLMLVCLPPGLGVWALLSLGWGWGIPEPIPLLHAMLWTFGPSWPLLPSSFPLLIPSSLTC